MVGVGLGQGQIWWCTPAPSVGREQGGRRPVLIISNEDYHRRCTELAFILPITSTDRSWPNHVQLSGQTGLPNTSFAMTEQIKCVSRERLEKRIGQVSPLCLNECLKTLRFLIFN